MHTVLLFHNIGGVEYLPQFPFLQIGYSSTQSSFVSHFPATFMTVVVKLFIAVIIVAIITYKNMKIKAMEELHTFGVSISAYLVGSPVGRSG